MVVDSAEASSPVPGGVATGQSAQLDWSRIYVGAVVLGALAFLGLMTLLQATWSHLPRFSLIGILFFTGIGIFADSQRIRLGNGMEVSAAFLADFLAATILGPLGGALVAVGAFPGWFERGNTSRNLFVVSSFVLTTGVTAIVYWFTAGLISNDFLGVVVPGVLAAATYQTINFGLFVPIMYFRRGVRPLSLFHEAFAPFVPFHVFFLFISLVLLFSFNNYGTASFLLYLLPVLGLVYAFRAFARERDLAQSLEQFSLEMAGSMLTALDLKDNYTGQHSAAVALYSYDTAAELRLSSRERALAHLGGLLHDVGKISIPDSILNCPTTLGEAEWEVVQGHAGAGQEILSNMTEFEELGRIILHHHERFDGQGYPRGLESGDIPLVSRIVAIADSYSAMVSERPYSRKREPEEAMAELRSASGSQFDPYVAEAFLAVLSRGDEDYRRGQKADFRVQFQKVRFLRDIT